MPVLNVPFRLIAAYNPQRFGVLNNNLQPTAEVHVPVRGRHDVLRHGVTDAGAPCTCVRGWCRAAVRPARCAVRRVATMHAQCTDRRADVAAERPMKGHRRRSRGTLRINGAATVSFTFDRTGRSTGPDSPPRSTGRSRPGQRPRIAIGGLQPRHLERHDLPGHADQRQCLPGHGHPRATSTGSGVLCTRVYDVGKMADAASFEISVVHP